MPRRRRYRLHATNLLEDDQSCVSEISDPDDDDDNDNDDDASVTSTSSSNRSNLRVQWGGSIFYTIEGRHEKAYHVPLIEDRFGSSGFLFWDSSLPCRPLGSATNSCDGSDDLAPSLPMRITPFSNALDEPVNNACCCDGSDDRAPTLPRRNSCPDAWDDQDYNDCCCNGSDDCAPALPRRNSFDLSFLELCETSTNNGAQRNGQGIVSA